MIRTGLAHKIYELCIDVFFDHLEKNFPKEKPELYIGEKFKVIEDSANGEYYFDCEVIHPADLSYIEDLTYDGVQIADISLAIRFKAYKSHDGTFEEYDEYEDPEGDDEIHFERHEMKDLVFKK